MREACHYCEGVGYLQRVIFPRGYRPAWDRERQPPRVPSRVKCLVCDGTGRAPDPAARRTERGEGAG